MLRGRQHRSNGSPRISKLGEPLQTPDIYGEACPHGTQPIDNEPTRHMNPHHERQFVLLLSCPDRLGIVRDVGGYIASLGANITRAEQSNLGGNSHFYQRIEFEMPTPVRDTDSIRQGLQHLIKTYDAAVSLRPKHKKPRTAILVSKYSHCLRDLISRYELGDLPIDLVCVVSNHPDLQEIADRAQIPFRHMPVTSDSRREQEQELDAHLRDSEIDLVVMARYMQILTDRFVSSWPNTVINIHHSFLPAFAGAKPYHRALERGVKLIGATAHYATAELDEGPVIAQGVTETTHRDSLDDLLRKGRAIESRILATAVRAHAQRKVIVAGNRTVVFS